MLSFHLGRTRLDCSAFFLGLLTFCAAYKEGGVLLLMLFSVLVHELGHLLAMGGLGIGVRRVEFGLGHITVEPTHPGDVLQQVFVLLAGPLANLLLSALFFRVDLLYAAYLNVALALVNMVPAGALDGGRLVYAAALQVLGARWAFRVSWMLSLLFGGAFVCAGVHQLFVLHQGPGILVFGGFIILSSFQNLRYTKPS